MSKVSKTFQVDAEDTKRVQSAHVKNDAMKDVITSFLTQHQNDTVTDAIDSPVFEAYQEKQQKAYLEYEQAKSDLQAKYIPMEIQQAPGSNWTLDYNKSEITVTYNA